MVQKVILCDLDKTLIDREYKLTVPLSTLTRVIQQTQDEGLLIGLNSDTPLLPLQAWAREFGMRGPVIGEMGRVLTLSPEGPAREHGKLSDLFLSLKREVVVRAHEEFPQAFVGIGDVTEFIRHESRIYGVDRRAILVNAYRRFSFSAYALSNRSGKLNPDDNDFFEQFYDLVLRLVETNLTLLDKPDPNPEYGILILHEKGASKALGIEALFEEMPAEIEVVMIGDSDSDIVNTNRPVKVCAVSNASKALKEKALETGGIVADRPYTEGVVQILSALK